MTTSEKQTLVCGGAGFIGSHFVDLLATTNREIVVLDALTYAGSEANLAAARSKGKVKFVKARLEDAEALRKLIREHHFNEIINFAAETHVDRSIEAPQNFIQSNIVAVYTLLEVIKENRETLPKDFRFVQVSTDEVFGALGPTGKFNEKTAYSPRSPYSASKAAADLLCQAWFHTYGIPVLITNCSNNYGPRQFPEKLIPTVIAKALSGQPIPVYGEGKNIRDWIHVADHCAGVKLALENGRLGASYCFGGDCEMQNLKLVEKLCDYLDELSPKPKGKYNEQISFVKDRLGHDFRYAIDDQLAMQELGFKRTQTFEKGLRETAQWYLQNRARLKLV